MKNKIRDKYFICFAILFIVFELRGYTQNIGSVRLTTTKSIENLAKHEIISEDVIFTVVPRGLVISVATDDIFHYGGIMIKDSAHELLKNIADVIKKADKPCVIEGNALTQNDMDEISNIELSLMRADAIAEFFIKYCGISPNSLRAIGFGNMMPFDDNVSYKGHLNKRIDFVILNYEADR